MVDQIASNVNMVKVYYYRCDFFLNNGEIFPYHLTIGFADMEETHMKKQSVIMIIVLLLFTFFAAAAINDYEASEEGYTKMRQELGKLFREKKFSEAIALVKKHYNKYPGHLMAMSFNLAALYNSTQEYQKGIRVMRDAQKKGIWYSIWALEGEFFKEFRKYKSFKRVLENNKKMHAAAEAGAESLFEVRTPENFDPEKPYPLFIALHGGDGHIKEFRPNWDSDKLKKEFIVLYVQSSQMSSMDGYHWEDKARTAGDVMRAYRDTSSKYNIDRKRILIGGFSSGGGASLHLSFNGDIPVTGFISLCPALPGTITAETVSAAVKKGLSGTILTSELDGRIKDQRALADLMGHNGLQYQFVVTPNIGHWFPEDFDKKLDQAIVHIFSR